MKIQTTKIYRYIDDAIKQGYTTVSAQGSSRSSKTYNILIWLIVYCLQNPKTRLSIVRAWLPAIKGSVLIDFKEILEKMKLYDDIMLNKTELTYTFPNGSWVEFFSTDNEQKLKGRKRDILFVNEANELKFIEWQQLKMRTTKFSILDYNPSFSDDHWLCNLNKDKRTHHFITTYKDNPFLEQTIIDEIESLQHTNKSLWQIYGLGLQSMVEGLIFKDIELIDEIPSYVKYRSLALDYGFTNDPTAIVECAVYENNLYIDQLCYATHMLTTDIIDVLKTKPNYQAIAEVDPRLNTEIYNAGINIYNAKKGDIMVGINKMLEFKIHITRRSLETIKEFKNYTYKQDREGKWLNMPIDKFNHSIDAIRYYVVYKFMERKSKGISPIKYK